VNHFEISRKDPGRAGQAAKKISHGYTDYNPYIRGYYLNDSVVVIGSQDSAGRY
jgi:hypothetical protein